MDSYQILHSATTQAGGTLPHKTGFVGTPDVPRQFPSSPYVSVRLLGRSDPAHSPAWVSLRKEDLV